MGAQYLRAYYRASEDGADSGPLHFVASTDEVARDGLIIDAEAWQLDNYRRNPVVLWVHDYSGFRTAMPVIGRTEQLEVRDGDLHADIQFDPDDEFAQTVDRKYRNGYLHAVSVGWDTLEFAPGKGDAPPRVTAADLLDISAVPVPGDPNALIERQVRAFRALGLLSDIGADPDGSELRDLLLQGGRAGAGLSARNRELLVAARGAIDELLVAEQKDDDDERVAKVLAGLDQALDKLARAASAN